MRTQEMRKSLRRRGGGEREKTLARGKTIQYVNGSLVVFCTSMATSTWARPCLHFYRLTQQAHTHRRITTRQAGAPWFLGPGAVACPSGPALHACVMGKASSPLRASVYVTSRSSLMGRYHNLRRCLLPVLPVQCVAMKIVTLQNFQNLFENSNFSACLNQFNEIKIKYQIPLCIGPNLPQPSPLSSPAQLPFFPKITPALTLAFAAASSPRLLPPRRTALPCSAPVAGVRNSARHLLLRPPMLRHPSPLSLTLSALGTEAMPLRGRQLAPLYPLSFQLTRRAWMNLSPS